MLSQDHKFLLEALKSFKQQTGFKRKLGKRLRTENAREEKVASKYREKLFAKAMGAAGIDLVEVQARQERADVARDAKYEPLANELSLNANLVKDRQENWLKRIVNNHMGGPAPQSLDFGILSSANAITLDDKGHPRNAAIIVSPQNNILNFKWDFTNRHSVTELSVDATFDFVFTPPVSGNVQVFIPVIYNGSWFWNTYGSCIALLSSTYLIAGVDLTVMQNQAGGVISSEFQETVAFSLSKQGSACLGGAGMEPLETNRIIQPSPLPITSGSPVVISVDVWVESGILGAHDVVDFSSGVNNINVPGVLFGIS